MSPYTPMSASGGCGCGGGQVTLHGSQRGCCCGPDSCEGLQCLCRPRFYDGQVITAADFRRLDEYSLAKSRLHNRYLHGTGAVCGLEVIPSACDDSVVVRSGYALGPCGEDIVICEDIKVDLGGLIRDVRRAQTVEDCPPYNRPEKDPERGRQTWVLGVCYEEHLKRVVAPAKPAARGCGGSCGGSCGGGCAPRRPAPTGCEPTEVCEGFRFRLTKLRPGDRKPAVPGELPRRVLAALDRFSGGLSGMPDKAETDELIGYAHDLAGELRDVLTDTASAPADLIQALGGIQLPNPGERNAQKLAVEAISRLFNVAAGAYREAMCSALLPPCGVETEDCIPLAVLTLRSEDLRVLDICNWSARKFAVTSTNLSYWFGWMPIVTQLRESIARLCCHDQPVGLKFADRAFQLEQVEHQDFRPAGIFSHTLFSAMTGGPTEAPDPLRDLVLGGQSVVPAGFLRGLLGDQVPTDMPAGLNVDVESLVKTVASLTTKVNSQARALAVLKKQVNP